MSKFKVLNLDKCSLYCASTQVNSTQLNSSSLSPAQLTIHRYARIYIDIPEVADLTQCARHPTTTMMIVSCRGNWPKHTEPALEVETR